MGSLAMAQLGRGLSMYRGKGILKRDYRKIFNPGHTAKQRGWGLGLSLVRRIIEDYHQGKIKVLDSKVGRGTTMQIILKLAE